MNPTTNGLKCAKCRATFRMAFTSAVLAGDACCPHGGDHDFRPAAEVDMEWADAVFASMGIPTPALTSTGGAG